MCPQNFVAVFSIPRVAGVLSDFGCTLTPGKMARIRPADQDICLSIMDYALPDQDMTRTRALNTLGNRVLRTVCVGSDEDLQVRRGIRDGGLRWWLMLVERKMPWPLEGRDRLLFGTRARGRLTFNSIRKFGTRQIIQLTAGMFSQNAQEKCLQGIFFGVEHSCDSSFLRIVCKY